MVLASQSSRTSRVFCQRSGSALVRAAVSGLIEWALAKRAVSERAPFAMICASVECQKPDARVKEGWRSNNRRAYSQIAVVRYNKRLQRTVMDKVPRYIRQRAAAEPRRYAPSLYVAL